MNKTLAFVVTLIFVIGALGAVYFYLSHQITGEKIDHAAPAPGTAPSKNPIILEKPETFADFFGSSAPQAFAAIQQIASSSFKVNDWSPGEAHPLIYAASSDKNIIVTTLFEPGENGSNLFSINLHDHTGVSLFGTSSYTDARAVNAVLSPNTNYAAWECTTPNKNKISDSDWDQVNALCVYNFESGLKQTLVTLEQNTSFDKASSYGSRSTDIGWLNNNTLKYGIYSSTPNASSTEDAAFYNLIRSGQVSI